jgi:hypothetical protein
MVPEREINWNHISLAYFRGKCADDCKVQWRSWDHPKFSKAMPSEDEVLNLLDIVERGEFQNWFEVAAALRVC